MTTILSNRRSKFGMTCVQCDNELIAPEWSQYQNERQIRHLWHCSVCDLCFESVVSFSCRQQAHEKYQDGERYFPVAVPVAARRIGQFSGSRAS